MSRVDFCMYNQSYCLRSLGYARDDEYLLFSFRSHEFREHTYELDTGFETSKNMREGGGAASQTTREETHVFDDHVGFAQGLFGIFEQADDLDPNDDQDHRDNNNDNE